MKASKIEVSAEAKESALHRMSDGAPVLPIGEFGEDGEFASSGEATTEEASPISPISPTGIWPDSRPVWPANTSIDAYVDFLRGVTESADSVIVGSILPVLGAALGRRVWIDFGGRKFANLYHFLAGPPGISRKSTTFTPATLVARSLLDDHEQIGGSMSSQSFFDSFYDDDEEADSTRLWMETEGNKLTADLRTEVGKPLATSLLKTYDGDRLEERYLRNKEGKHGSPVRVVKHPLLNLCVAITPGSARLAGVTSGDGLRRRFCYYFAPSRGRTIDWPRRVEDSDIERLAESFRPLKALSGRMELSSEAMHEIYVPFKREVDAITEKRATDCSPENEAFCYALAESLSHSLKRAMIFQAVNGGSDWQTIDAETMSLAIEHQRFCLRSSLELDRDAERNRTKELAEIVLAKLRSSISKPPESGSGLIPVSRSELTSIFCNNPGRPNSLTTHDLYSKIIPVLKSTGDCQILEKTGKREVYGFRPGT